MSRRFYPVLLTIVLLGSQTIFAQNNEQPAKPTIDLELSSDSDFIKALESSTDIEMITRDRNNGSGGRLPEESVSEKSVTEEKPAPSVSAPGGVSTVPMGDGKDKYLEESQRLLQLAEETYEYGDYDAALLFAQEAIEYAQLSDEHITTGKVGSKTTTAPTTTTTTTVQAGSNERIGNNVLPASYTIRPWSVSRDCFWNIAGRSWVYGDSHQWHTLYNANKAKLSDPNNPDKLDPGIVLDIPSLKGETRQGAWDPAKAYEPLR
jgi:hypothetical protein